MTTSRHRKAYSYVNKHGKIVHVKERGIASAEPPPAPKRTKKEKLTAESWCRQMHESLDEWAAALGHDEVFHLYDDTTGAHLDEEEIARFLKIHGPRLRKAGFYIMNRQGKILPPTNKKKSRKPLSAEAWASRLRINASDWAREHIPDEPDWFKRRDAFLASHGIKLYSAWPDADTPINVTVDEWQSQQPEKQRAWFAANKKKFLSLGIPLIDVYGNDVSAPPKSLPPPPLTQHNASWKLGQECRALGFPNLFLSSRTRQSPAGLATAQSLVKALKGLHEIFDVPDAAGKQVRLRVDAIDHAMVAATYSSWEKEINLDHDRGGQTFYHEFGHYLDHFTHSPDLSETTFATNNYENVSDSSTPAQKAAREFVLACQASESYANWASVNLAGHKNYFRIPTEMFARFFDMWCAVRLEEKGLNPYAYSCVPFRYQDTGGGFSREDFNALRPVFEKVILPHIKKALTLFLSKSRTTGAVGKAPKRGRYGALVSSDPSFYPQKGGVRYLSASEVGRVGDIIQRYAKRGMDVRFVATAPVTDPVEPQSAPHEPSAAMQAVHAHVAGAPLTPAQVAMLPNIGVDPQSMPMHYLVSAGWPRRAKGRNVFTAQESAALIHEASPLMQQAVRATVARLRLSAAQQREMISNAALAILETATTYDASKRGTAGPGRNLAALLAGSLRRRLVGDAVEARRVAASYEPYVEQASEATPSLQAAARAARIETPEQRLRRHELSVRVSQSLVDMLPPIEYATVSSRLNIYQPQTTGTVDDVLDTGLRVGGLKPWARVKADVQDYVAIAPLEVEDNRRLREAVERLPAAQYRVVFERAMQRLRGPSGLDQEQKQELAELAELQRLYLEGLRHETFTPEHTGQLHDTEEEDVTLKAMADLPIEDQSRAFFLAHPDVAKALRPGPATYSRLRELCTRSTDALRAAQAWSAGEDAVQVAWALSAVVEKDLSVIPPFETAWDRLVTETTVWAENGW